MQRSSSFGTSWADQWDNGGDPSPRDGGKRESGGGAAAKTKAATASRLRKVKEGTARGFRWIKDKCQLKNNGGGKRQGSDVAGY